MLRIALVVIGLSFALMTAPPAVNGQTGGLALRDAVGRANLALVGQVASIDFRESERREGLVATPFTFVTYRVERVLGGAWEKDQITLGFIGGYEPSTGRVALDPRAPMFRVGNRDLLLVRGNGDAYCPLVGCGSGRFRLVDGAVYANMGLAVREGFEGRMHYGPDALPDSELAFDVPAAPESRLRSLRERLASPDLDTVERERVETMLRILSGPQTIGVARIGAQTEPQTEPPMAEVDFVAQVRDLADGMGATPERSVSPDEPILVRAPVVVRPDPTPRRPDPWAQRTREQFLLERNGGNPVLGTTP